MVVVDNLSFFELLLLVVKALSTKTYDKYESTHLACRSVRGSP